MQPGLSAGSRKKTDEKNRLLHCFLIILIPPYISAGAIKDGIGMLARFRSFLQAF